MPPRLDALTPLRFVAAAMIVVGHGATLFGFAPGPAALHAANAGVSFFFVLSGFVLAYNTPALADRGARQRFFAMRFARILPLHAFTRRSGESGTMRAPTPRRRHDANRTRFDAPPRP